MKLNALRVREVGTWAQPMAFEGLSAGLNVYVAANEAGKSTLLRALKTVFAENHTSGNKRIDVLRPYSGGAPLIEVDFELDGRTWRITKQFLSGKSSTLTDLDRQNVIARGREADEELKAMLAPEVGGAPMLGTFWLGQKDALSPFQAEGDDHAFFRSQLEREVIDSADSGQLRRLKESLMTALAAQLTPGSLKGVASGAAPITAKKNSEWWQRDQAAKSAAAAFDDLDARRVQAATDTAELAEIQEQEKLLGAPQAVAARADALVKAEASVRQMEAARGRFDAAVAVLAGAEAAIQSAEKRFQEFSSDVARLDAMTKRMALGAKQIAERDQRLADATAKLAKARTAKAAATTAYDSARRRHETARTAAEFSRVTTELQTLETRAHSVRALAAEREQIRQLQEATSAVTGERIQAARRETRDIERLTAMLEAAAPSVQISYLAGISDGFAIGDGAVRDGTTLKPTAPIVIAATGLGAITVTPSLASDGADAAADLTAHTEQLNAVLGAMGVSALSDAEAMHNARTAREARLREITAISDGLGAATLAAELQAARAAHAQLQDVAAVASDDTDINRGGLAIDETEAALQAATTDQTDAVEAETAAVQAVAELQTERAALASTQQAGAENHAELETRLGDETARATQQMHYATALSDTRRDYGVARQRHDDERQKAGDGAAFSAAVANVDAARTAIAFADAQLTELAVARAGLAEGLRRDQAEGLGEKVVVAEANRDLLQHDLDDLRETIDAQILLLTEVEAAETSRRDRLFAPVNRALAPYVTTLFPNAEVDLGEDFGIGALVRGNARESVANLSDGTQEQLAILARIGLAHVLADAGTPRPFILDDPLAYADDARLSHMFSALQTASSAFQIIVLSCHARAFAPLEGHRIQPVPWTPPLP